MFRPPAVLAVDTASSVLEEGLHAIESGQSMIDLADVTTVDSTAVATMLAWRRAARQKDISLRFDNLPDNLHSLVTLYDVSVLLGLEGSSAAQRSSSDELLPH